ncbi:MAG: hypothetical protein RIT27_750 [Pseudomonadota bacterium]|jgi:ligand-binding sensor protein
METLQQGGLSALFNIDKLQIIQDAFAQKAGVASIITETNGIPITKPSNFCRLCMNVIRKTEKGLANCIKSDAIVGKYNPDGPTIQPCLSGGLWDAGASIAIKRTHIANWLIGQVLNEEQATDLNKMMLYAQKIGADLNDFSHAISFVNVMDLEKFTCISHVLFLFSTQLSNLVTDGESKDFSVGRQKLLQRIAKQPDLNALLGVWDKMAELYQQGDLCRPLK